MSLQYTPLEDIEKIYTGLADTFKSSRTRPVLFRKTQILQVAYLLKDNRDRFLDALKADLGRPAFESGLLEIDPVLGEAVDAFRHVASWAKPQSPPFSFSQWGAMKRTIYKEPKGAVLIIGPFNYPVFLMLGPLIAALAAGCTVAMKMSELTPATSNLMAELIPKYLDPDVVKVVNGAAPEVTVLMSHPWGHVFFTGSGRVGKIIAQKAAQYLTPVTLELGGKSPTIMDDKLFAKGKEHTLRTYAQRIIWGKGANAGQTCVAPDYVLVCGGEENVKKLAAVMKEVYKDFYGDMPTSDNMSSMVNVAAYKRANDLLSRTKGTIVLPTGTRPSKENERFMPVTVVTDVQLDDALMESELFAPILPMLAVKDLDEAITIVNSYNHPLAMYIFTEDQATKEKAIQHIQSGAACVSEVVIHVGAEGLPFGGIGPSGYGQHTGKYGFDTFTHLRSSLESPVWLERVMKIRYPPYTDTKQKLSAYLAPSLPARPTSEKSSIAKKWWILIVALAMCATLTRSDKLRKLILAKANV